MYRLGRRQVHHYVIYGIAIIFGAALLIGIVTALKQYLQPHTILKQAPAITHTVTADQLATQRVAQSVFSLELPKDWRAVPAPQTRFTAYSWAGTGTYSAARRLDVYIDTIPTDMAVNRLLPVEATGNQLEPTGSVSDNCVSFTDKTAASTATGKAPSKWGGVNFLCDMSNYERDVVAIGSPNGVNQVSLRGSTAGTHRILLIYTDNNATPDYTIFVAAVKSFRLK